MPLDYATAQGSMQASNWFGVGVRLLGVWEVVNGLDELVAFGNVVMRLSTSSLTTPNGYLSHAIAHLLVGFFLLFAAKSVADTVYPPEPPSADDQSEAA